MKSQIYTLETASKLLKREILAFSGSLYFIILSNTWKNISVHSFTFKWLHIKIFFFLLFFSLIITTQHTHTSAAPNTYHIIRGTLPLFHFKHNKLSPLIYATQQRTCVTIRSHRNSQLPLLPWSALEKERYPPIKEIYTPPPPPPLFMSEFQRILMCTKQIPISLQKNPSGNIQLQ